jgi:hypothetical protein
MTVAACQPVPRPFMPDEGIKGPKTLAPLEDGGGIVVLAVENVPPPVSEALRRAMIDALAEQNIPAAASGSNVLSRFLTGTARKPSTAGATTVEVTWELADRAGRKLGTGTARMSVPPEMWAAASHKALAPLADGAAPAIAALMQEPSETRALQPREIPLHVWPVAGAGRDGALALRLAMEAALGRRGFSVTETLADNGLVIAGSVALGAVAEGKQPIAIEWTVLDGGGKELGKLDQKNAIPADALKNGWGPLAYVIAESAAGGVGALLTRLPARPAGAGS